MKDKLGHVQQWRPTMSQWYSTTSLHSQVSLPPKNTPPTALTLSNSLKGLLGGTNNPRRKPGWCKSLRTMSRASAGPSRVPYRTVWHSGLCTTHFLLLLLISVFLWLGMSFQWSWTFSNRTHSLPKPSPQPDACVDGRTPERKEQGSSATSLSWLDYPLTLGGAASPTGRQNDVSDSYKSSTRACGGGSGGEE